MARKRIAGNELNHDNWDEYESEEAGTFKKAPSSVLENRVIKTAKRRNPISSVSSETSTKNVFSSFGGFTKTTQSTTSSPFGFLSNLADTQNKTNGVNTPTPVSTVGSEAASSSIFKLSGNKPMMPAESTNNNKNEKSAEYYSKLKGLNESVADWIKQHVDKNPLCILTPIFKDYEKYLTEIEHVGITDKDKTPVKNTSSSSIFSIDVKTTQASGIPAVEAFGSSVNKVNETNKSNSEESLQSTASTSAVTTKPAFSFGTLPTATTSTTGFSFGSGKPFTFSNVTKPESTENSSTNDQEDESDEPPKVEFKRVVEEGSIFSQRCKVFVKKDGSFGDRGVGQLFLKPVAGSEKIQLIVRADTNLGNLLLNFILSETIPMQRMGKNNVMLVSIPTPDAKPPPAPILLRVKTAEEADDLLKVLEKHKK